MADLPRLKVSPWPSHTETETRQLGNSSIWRDTYRQASFKAFAANALTTFDAGLAAIFFISPNIILVVALRAGLRFSLSMAMPGTTNLPFFFTSAVTISPNDSNTPLRSFFFKPVVVLIASYIPPAVILVDAFMAFMAFIAFIAGAMLSECWSEVYVSLLPKSVCRGRGGLA